MSQQNVQKCLEKLAAFGSGSDNQTQICEMLMKLRPYSKKPSGIKSILDNGGAEVLLQYLQGPNRRILDISISIIANCLTEDAFQHKVFECQGIPHIMRILQCIKSFSILSRTCRCIANLAAHHESAKTMHASGTVELIVELTRNASTTTDCIFSALRAFKNLGNTPYHRKKLVQQGVVSAIARLIPFKTKEVATAAVRALSAISRSCTIEFADHMLSSDGIAISELIKIARGNAEYSSIIKKHALIVLQNLTLQACTRPTLGSFNGIELFVMEVRNIVNPVCNAGMPQSLVEGPLPENAYSLVSSLCYCCREAINRARLRSLGALPIFVYVLKDPRWQPVHLFILGSLQCFVYDEEGLKILHESGIFGVMLDKLEEYCLLEFEEDSGTMIRDGHDIDEKESFDRRQSLSYDLPTKFNDRPQSKIVSKCSYKPNVSWDSSEDIPAYSPQWSPINQSILLDELATFTSSSEDPSYSTNSSISKSRICHENEMCDLDESSSSRDGFDSLRSPTLLPITHVEVELSNDADTEGCSSTKSDNKGYERSINHELPSRASGIQVTQIYKKAKLTIEDKSSSNNDVESIDKNTGLGSPSRDSILDEASVGKCSPSFLKFVEETCSSPSSLTEHRMSTKSILKQPKRKFSSPCMVANSNEATEDATTPKQLELFKCSPTTLATDSVTEDSSDRQLPTESIDNSGPYSIYEEPTPIKVVLGLLCHYCEVSDSYVSSLCQEENCAQSIVTHLRYCNSLDLKTQRIIDKLTSCSKCFKDVISSNFVPMLASVCSTRIQSVSCIRCKLSSDSKGRPQNGWYSLLDNVWHNVALIQSSFYGSSLIDSSLSKWTIEAKSITITLLLLTLWYDETGKLCNIAEELRRKLYSNLKLIAENGYLLQLLHCMLEREKSEVFEAICFLSHKLASRVDLSKPRRSVKSDHTVGLTGNSSVDTNKVLCFYDRDCQSRTPDRELRICCNEPTTVGKEQLSDTRKQQSVKSPKAAVTIPIHSDVLISGSLMFRTMLTGSYKEANEKMITLMDSSYASSMFVVHLLYGCDRFTCPHMKLVNKQINNSHFTHDTLIAVPTKQGIELEILKTMDLWIVQQKKDEFIFDFMEFFMEKYVRPEVTMYNKELQCQHDKKPGQDHQSSSAATEAMLSSCFWDFICMHKYHSLANRYVEEFCCPCSFQHNHIKYGEALANLFQCLQEHETFCEIFYKKMDHILQEVLLPKLVTDE